METKEAFHAVIKLDTSKTDNDFMVMGINEIEPPLISVEDNDGDPDTIGEGTVDFIVDDDFNFSLASVSQERPFNRFEKYFIDYISKDGLPQHIYEDLKRVLKSGVESLLEELPCSMTPPFNWEALYILIWMLRVGLSP